MKTKLTILTLCMCSMLFLTACDNDDDNYSPGTDVAQALKSKYPNAQKIEWEKKDNYLVAEFHLDAKEAKAWFENSGNWIMTETDCTFNELPEAVQNSFKAGEYASWKIDDIDRIERLNTPIIYIIEVEKSNREFDLYYATDGILLKAVEDNNSNQHKPLEINNTIKEEIARLYPNAKIIEIEKENNGTEVDIFDNNKYKEVWFNAENKWVSTQWEIRQSEVPVAVMNALKTSAYGSYRIDDIDAMQKPDGMYYVFELESGDKEIKITIKQDGSILN